MNADFQEPPQWAGQLDLAARLSAVPSGRTVKGFVFNAAAGRLRLGTSYAGFRDYPLEDFLRLLDDGANGDPLRLEAAGRAVGPSLKKSMVGRVLLALAGDSVDGLLDLAQRLYRVGVSFGDLEVERVGPREAIVRLRDVWAFHPYLFGSLASALETVEPAARIAYRKVSMTGFDIRVIW
ncbi:MAG: DUF2378 family protein [Sandaracinaceae bacterium]